MGTPVPSKIREHEYSEKVTEPEVVKRQLTEEERKYYDSLAKPKKKAVYIYPEDEDLYINQREDGEEMPKRIEAPSKEELTELCKKYPGKYRASVGIAEHYGISRSTVERWILDNGLKGLWDQPDSKDKKSRDIEECKPVKGEKPTKEQLEKLCKNYPNIYQASCAIGSIYGVHRTTVSNWIKAYGIDVWKKSDGIYTNEVIAQINADLEGCSGEPDQDTNEFNGVIKDEEPVKYKYLEDPNDPNELTLGVQPGDGQIHYPEEEKGTQSKKPLEAVVTFLNGYRIGETFKYNGMIIDIQYDKQEVVLTDESTLEEGCLPFSLFNMITNLIIGRQEK